MGLSEHIVLNPIKNVAYLQDLIDAGYSLKGPRENALKNLIVFKRILKKHEFIPEEWLAGNGYQFVEPSTFTRGLKLAYKIDEGTFQECFKSNYSLCKENREIPLYLKKEE